MNINPFSNSLSVNRVLASAVSDIRAENGTPLCGSSFVHQNDTFVGSQISPYVRAKAARAVACTRGDLIAKIGAIASIFMDSKLVILEKFRSAEIFAKDELVGEYNRLIRLISRDVELFERDSYSVKKFSKYSRIQKLLARAEMLARAGNFSGEEISSLRIKLDPDPARSGGDYFNYKR